MTLTSLGSGMFGRRRMRRRRSTGSRKSSTMHVPSTMNNVLDPSEGLILYAAIPSNYATVGTPLSADRYENVDRLQNVAIGSEIQSIIYNIAISSVTTPGIIEYAIFKVERATSVPTTDGVYLPTPAEIVSIGLQAAMRQYQPGRVIKFGNFAVAAEQPRTVSLKGAYGKFRMAKVRTGDYYGIIVFSRGATSIVDVQSRYNSKL